MVTFKEGEEVSVDDDLEWTVLTPTPGWVIEVYMGGSSHYYAFRDLGGFLYHERRQRVRRKPHADRQVSWCRGCGSWPGATNQVSQRWKDTHVFIPALSRSKAHRSFARYQSSFLDLGQLQRGCRVFDRWHRPVGLPMEEGDRGQKEGPCRSKTSRSSKEDGYQAQRKRGRGKPTKREWRWRKSSQRASSCWVRFDPRDEDQAEGQTGRHQEEGTGNWRCCT